MKKLKEKYEGKSSPVYINPNLSGYCSEQFTGKTKSKENDNVKDNQSPTPSHA